MQNLLLGIYASKVSGSSEDYLIPENAIILWNSTSDTLPSNFEVYTSSSRILVRCAAASGSSTTVAGALTHIHSMPTSGSTASHSHSWTPTSAVPSVTEDWGASGGFATSSSTHTHTISATTSSSGSHTHTSGNCQSASNLPSCYGLYYIKNISGSTPCPVGTIIMSANSLSNMMSGWQLCNGTNGTPDLRGKFIYSALVDSSVGTTSGSDSHTHVHPSATNSGGTHSHTISAGTTSTNSSAGTSASHSSSEDVRLANQPHTHTFSAVTTSTDSNHTHTLSSTNSSSTLPPYTSVFYIMKVI